MSGDAPRFADLHRVRLLLPVAEAKLDAIVRDVVADMAALPQGSRPREDDESFADAWQAYVDEVQNGEGPTFGAYVRQIEAFAYARLKAEPPETRALLWTMGDAYFEAEFEDGEDDLPHDEEMTEALVEGVRQRVNARAADKESPDDGELSYAARARLEDDEVFNASFGGGE